MHIQFIDFIAGALPADCRFGRCAIIKPMRRLLHAIAVIVVLTSGAVAQDIPAELHGKWKITREVRTGAISCWGSKEGKQLIGTEIEYTADSLRWDGRVAAHPKVAVSQMSAEQFREEYSGGGSAGSLVTFSQLGIRSANVKQIVLSHPDSKPIDGAPELPGDAVFLKSKNRIVFSVCNLYFEAQREPAPKSGSKQE